MLKNIWLLIFLFVLFLTTPRVSLAFSGAGVGTSGNPYKITTCNQLSEMASAVTSYYQIQNNIDCTGVTYTPAGDATTKFSGTLEGQNYTISNLNITASAEGQGLIGYANGATIRNVRIAGGSITSSAAYVGSLIGRDYGGGTTISHSSSTMTLQATAVVGGLVGKSDGALSIQNSFYNGSVTATFAAYDGGLVGWIAGSSNSITNCYTQGSLSAQDTYYIGSIVGLAAGLNLSNCYSTMTMATEGGNYIGGLVGNITSGSVSNVFFAGSMSGVKGPHGSIFGGVDITPSATYFDSYITGTTACNTDNNVSCTAINSENTTPNYFKTNSTNPPLSSWNFSSIWQIMNGYPDLVGFGTSAYEPPPSLSLSAPGNSASAPVCNDSAPSEIPQLLSIISAKTSVTLKFTNMPSSGYSINYGLSSSADQFGDLFNLAGASIFQRTISGLAPNTTYFYKIRATNGCNAGQWSKTVSAKTKR